MESINEATLEHCCVVAYRTSNHRLGIEIGFWSMIPRDKGFFLSFALMMGFKRGTPCVGYLCDNSNRDKFSGLTTNGS